MVLGSGLHVRITGVLQNLPAGNRGRDIFEQLAGSGNAQPGLEALWERMDLGSSLGYTTSQ